MNHVPVSRRMRVGYGFVDRSSPCSTRSAVPSGESVKLPENAILIPGTITHSNVLVEHPQVVADRILRFAEIVGRENVIAGADCGFATFAGSEEIHESIVWAKLRALAEGAQIASRELWGRPRAAARA